MCIHDQSFAHEMRSSRRLVLGTKPVVPRCLNGTRNRSCGHAVTRAWLSTKEMWRHGKTRTRQHTAKHLMHAQHTYTVRLRIRYTDTECVCRSIFGCWHSLLDDTGPLHFDRVHDVLDVTVHVLDLLRDFCISWGISSVS